LVKNLCSRAALAMSAPKPSLLDEFAALLREVEAAGGAWASLDLAALQASLADEALSIADRHETALAARAALGARVRAFRTAVTGDGGAAVAAAADAIEAFKAEVDALAARAKRAEAATLALCVW
jgi:hypothetical protein